VFVDGFHFTGVTRLLHLLLLRSPALPRADYCS
jgi:hypothetical protein